MASMHKGGFASSTWQQRASRWLHGRMAAGMHEGRMAAAPHRYRTLCARPRCKEHGCTYRYWLQHAAQLWLHRSAWQQRASRYCISTLRQYCLKLGAWSVRVLATVTVMPAGRMYRVNSISTGVLRVPTTVKRSQTHHNGRSIYQSCGFASSTC
jgi:hypothetical protein